MQIINVVGKKMRMLIFSRINKVSCLINVIIKLVSRFYVVPPAYNIYSRKKAQLSKYFIMNRNLRSRLKTLLMIFDN